MPKENGLLVILGPINVHIQPGIVQLTKGDLLQLGSEKLLQTRCG